jgi:hypothetical protein
MYYQEIQSKEVTVRKDHRCSWCGERIPAGQRAHYRAYTFDGFQTDYMHPECHDAMENHHDLEDGFNEGGFKRGSVELK